MELQDRPYSVNMIAGLLQELGDKRGYETIRVHIIRAIHSGSLEGAYKADPDKQTVSWQIPAKSVERWINEH